MNPKVDEHDQFLKSLSLSGIWYNKKGLQVKNSQIKHGLKRFEKLMFRKRLVDLLQFLIPLV